MSNEDRVKDKQLNSYLDTIYPEGWECERCGQYYTTEEWEDMMYSQHICEECLEVSA